MTESQHTAGSTLTNDPPVFLISVIMECRRVSRGDWSWPEWRVHGVTTARSAASDSAAGLETTRIDSEKDVERYLSTGLVMRFYRDAAEIYWHNLQGRQPSMFVVCRPRDAEETGSVLAPFLVTVDQSEAEAYIEGDDTVFAVPIPQDVYGRLERFVMDYYRPSQQRKRKRNKWSDNRDPDASRKH
ncbi:MAG: DUF3305 domain-containing protein [Gammaproteobacteria bacterium]|nr:DUF3305 domain-containing protein [Gammaproteobacteria bacterium]